MKSLEYLKSISNPTKLRLISLLLNGELCVCELEEITRIKQVNISKNLISLKDSGIVEVRREKQRGFYSLTNSFTSNKNGKYKVWLLNTKTNKLKKILKGGLKYYQLEYDYSFPIIAWQQGGDKVAMVYEKKGKLLLKTLDLTNKTKEVSQFFKFDKIICVKIC